MENFHGGKAPSTRNRPKLNLYIKAYCLIKTAVFNGLSVRTSRIRALYRQQAILHRVLIRLIAFKVRLLTFQLLRGCFQN